MTSTFSDYVPSVIINLTQHPATPEQKAQGVFDCEGEKLELLKRLLTFDELPSQLEVESRAAALAYFASDASPDAGVGAAMIGGAPYLMATLECQLRQHCIQPVYAFSKRVSEEKVMPDGSVQKINVFKHIGFVTGA